MDSLTRQQSSKSPSTIIRAAVKEDCAAICQLIYELASYQGFTTGPTTTKERLESDGFPTPPSQPVFSCAVAVNSSTGVVVGFAMFFPFYSTWRGKGLYLEDLYVQPEFRHRGTGRNLLAYAAKFALDTGCNQMRLAVLKRNTLAQKFYAKYEFENHTVEDGFELDRFNLDALKKIAGQTNDNHQSI